MSKQIETIRNFEYHPNDLAVALYAVIHQQYGQDDLTGLHHKWFPWRHLPVSLVDIKVGLNELAKGLNDGFFEIKPIDAYLAKHKSAISICVPQKFQNNAVTLLNGIDEYLLHKSIYRGKAITVKGDFLDLSRVNYSELVYSEDVLTDLRAHVWSLIERPDVCQKLRIKPPSKILFSGKFGSGKTMAMLWTAQKAVQNGWTFLDIEPEISEFASKNIAQVLEIAIKYQPTVISLEDVDREQRQHDPFALGNFMAALDGPISKGAKIIILMSTNYLEKIATGIQRPGRIDKIINFDRFGGEDVQSLLRQIIPVEYLSPNINWRTVEQACKDYQAAFVARVGTMAEEKTIGQNYGDKPLIVTEEELISAATDLRTQYKLCTAEQVG